MSEPSVTLTCKPRSVEAMAEAVELVDPEGNPELQPRDIDNDGDIDTCCNFFVSMLFALLGCPLPKGLRANDIVLYWRKELDGWRKVTPAEAMAFAARGLPVGVGWFNPKGHPGHVAAVRAAPAGQSGVFIAQCGRSNFALGKLIRGFGHRAPLEFFAHD